MSVFIDTGVLYAHHDTDAARHDAAVAAFDSVLAGEYGYPYTSDYILDESVTLTRQRTGSFTAADGVACRILGENPYPAVMELLVAGIDDVHGAVDAFRRFDDHALSFTDAMTVSLVQDREIDAVLSFDDDFDGIIDRIMPGN